MRLLYYFLKALIIKILKPKIHISISTQIKDLKGIEDSVKIGAKSYISGKVGRYSYIGKGCELNANIGSFCSIANNVKTIDGTHPINYVSTSPVFYSIDKQCGTTFANYNTYKDILISKDGNVSVIIENDVWIGENVLLKGGITVGTGACIAMGAVVVKDVPPYCVVGGCPARILKKRFNDDDIEILIKSQWWNKDSDWLHANWRNFLDISIFKSSI